MKSKWSFFFIFFIWIYGFAEPYDPIALYLTWQKLPESTMTILWITPQNRTEDVIEYRKNGDVEWKKAQGTHATLPQQDFQLFLHSLELTDLSPDSLYEFRTGADAKIYKFKTAPAALSHPFNFIVGGDMYQKKIERMIKLCKEAAKFDPLFALLGGDLAYSFSRYSNENKDSFKRWLTWLVAWKNSMVTSDGRLVPMLPAIGNHEVKNNFGQTPAEAPLFYALFPMPGKQGYNVLDFDSYMSIYILDSGHTHPIPGDQTAWLKNVLQSRQKVPNKFALYHVPAYPSVRDFNDERSTMIRANWVPLFDSLGLNAAFENHEHSYKRSYPLKNNRIDPQGVLYLGDGAFGVENTRKPQKDAWFLAYSAATRFFLVVTVDLHQRTYKGVNEEGKVFDSYSQQIPLREEKPVFLEMPKVVP